jgi:hypothetical protein
LREGCHRGDQNFYIDSCRLSALIISRRYPLRYTPLRPCPTALLASADSPSTQRLPSFPQSQEIKTNAPRQAYSGCETISEQAKIEAMQQAQRYRTSPARYAPSGREREPSGAAPDRKHPVIQAEIARQVAQALRERAQLHTQPPKEPRSAPGHIS